MSKRTINLREFKLYKYFLIFQTKYEFIENLRASLVQDAKSQKMTRSSSADDLCANKVVGNWGRLSDGGEIPMSRDKTVNSKKLVVLPHKK